MGVAVVSVAMVGVVIAGRFGHDRCRDRCRDRAMVGVVIAGRCHGRCRDSRQVHCA